MAEKKGYKNVKVYAGGYPVWQRKGNYVAIGTEELKKRLDAGDPMLLVDSRPFKNKYLKGTVPGAISIPDSQFEKRQGLLPADKSIQLIFFCEGPT